MFQTLQIKDKEKEEIVSKIEKEMAGLEVIYSKEWSLPVYEYIVEFFVSEGRDLDVLEEEILKLVSLKFKTLQLNTDKISDMLGLDSIFVENYIIDLKELDVLEEWGDNLKLSSIGEEYYEKRKLPAEPSKKSITFYYDPLFKAFYSKIQGKTQQKYPYLTYSDSLIYNYFRETPGIDNKVINNLGKETGKRFERNELSEKITRIQKPTLINPDLFTGFLELWVHDIVADTVYIRIWDYGKKQFREDISDSIKDDVNYKEVLLEYYNKKEEDIEEYELDKEKIEKYENPVKDYYKEIRSSKEKSKIQAPEIKLLRSSEIKDELNNLFKSVNNKMMIISPWITKQAVDEEMIYDFKSIVKNGGLVYIGWGFAKKRELEEKEPPEELLDSLSNIKNRDGIPSVFVFWLGNTHNKEIIIDDKIHLLGSFNWLSYKGEYLPRGESVYKITVKEAVKKAAIDINKIFFEKIKEGYETSIDSMSERQNFINIHSLLGLNNVSDLVDEFLFGIKNRLYENFDYSIIEIIKLLIKKNRCPDLSEYFILELIKEKRHIKNIEKILGFLYEKNKAELTEFLKENKEVTENLFLDEKGKVKLKPVKELTLDFKIINAIDKHGLRRLLPA